MPSARRVLISSLLLSLSACAFEDLEDLEGLDGEEDYDEIGESELAATTTNGVSLNGVSLNGVSLNGVSLNGVSLNGVSLNGVSLNGVSLNGVSLNGSQLTGVNSNGQTISGTSWVGAQMTGTLSDGSSLTLRIDSAAALASPNTDVWAYGVKYALADGSWSPLCGTSGGAPVLAIPLAGTWNCQSGVSGGGSWTGSSSGFTFGCRGTALGKCVELGYKPWKTVSGVLLRDHHQACTRMIRADYCGDGTPWTQNGTQINVYDALKIQTDAKTWPLDAKWNTAGALCINNARVFKYGQPSCFAYKSSAQCGTTSAGVLVTDEYLQQK